jgi:hypothetical protein
MHLERKLNHASLQFHRLLDSRHFIFSYEKLVASKYNRRSQLLNRDTYLMEKGDG